MNYKRNTTSKNRLNNDIDNNRIDIFSKNKDVISSESRTDGFRRLDYFKQKYTDSFESFAHKNFNCK